MPRIIAQFVLASLTSIFATTIVGIRLQHGFVIAANGKPSYYGAGIKGSTTVCKLFRSGNFYFGIAGMAKDQNRNFFPERTIADSFSDSTSFESNVDRMELAISHSLKIEMKRLDIEDPAQFAFAMHKEGSDYLLTVIVGVMVGDSAHMAARAFKYIDGTNPDIKIDRLACPGDCSGENYAFSAGATAAADKALADSFKIPSWDPLETARKAVDSEIRASPETVGPPITILAVGNNGAVVDHSQQDSCPIEVEPIK